MLVSCRVWLRAETYQATVPCAANTIEVRVNDLETKGENATVQVESTFQGSVMSNIRARVEEVLSVALSNFTNSNQAQCYVQHHSTTLLSSRPSK